MTLNIASRIAGLLQAGLVSAGLMSASTFAESYRVEATLQGFASEGDYDEFQEHSYRAAGLRGAVYLQSVELGGEPWQLAAFLSRAGYIGASAFSGTMERDALIRFSDSNGSDVYQFQSLEDIDVDAQSFFARYVFSNGFTADVNVSQREESSDSESYENDTLGMTLGSYVGTRNWWGLRYQRLRLSHPGEDSKNDVHEYGVLARHVLREQDKLWIAVDYGAMVENGPEPDDAWELYGLFTFYINQQLGINFGVNIRDEDERDIGSFDVGVNYFVLPQLAVGLHLIARQIDYDYSTVDYEEEGLLLELTGRF